ncbi:hypothetical protein K435DRAFT_678818 [Dendrothele bispora CBS 962.96]|uniref:Tc1-like transposase DDE domain-containing protein n=1 Tax=Dendrothele bispora (strain CBS 962.96) TaxID=1314807 RepID=A0A4S8LIX8_DENBC|nr:hypothetical protein K435DRAFT_678818 [Dendrothele bispora CBS 962.96]
MKLIYLPPYSPDFDPIEEGFRSMKGWMRGNREYVAGELSGLPTADPYAMIWTAVYEAMTPANINTFYNNSGYWT